MESAKFSYPSGLMEAIKTFTDPQTCLEVVKGAKWGTKGPTCPRCESKRLSFLKTRLMWKCLDCQKQFSVKVGTLFEDSALSLDKWLAAVWLVTNCRHRASSFEIHRTIGVTQKTGWFILHRIRLAMQSNGNADS